MAHPGTVFLMYHELERPGRALCQPGAGYARYAVSESDFHDQMKSLRQDGWQGLNVTQFLSLAPAKSVTITFDDGSETDLLCGAPVLKEAGFGATFHVTAGWVGKPGYLSPGQLRELCDLGFEIGCHSATHPYLTDIDDRQLHEETAGAKNLLEQITGRAVNHFSCPGGRWDGRVLQAVRTAQFHSMATSRTKANSSHTDPFMLGRVAVLRNTGPEAFARKCRGEGLLATRLLEATRGAAARVLGNSAYDSIRSWLLGREGS
jgi:peptidoglycan/xylan/chitin deacetylase (PgdA/CDA1 family)